MTSVVRPSYLTRSRPSTSGNPVGDLVECSSSPSARIAGSPSGFGIVQVPDASMTARATSRRSAAVAVRHDELERLLYRVRG